MAFGQVRIEQMYAFVVVDDDGTEGVIGIPGPDGSMTPMVGADMDRVNSLVPIAKKLATMVGKAVEVLKFSTRTSVRVIKPGKGSIPTAPPRLDDQVERVAPASMHESIPVQMFDEPMLVRSAQMTGVVVSAATADGTPAVGLVFIDEEGKEMPPIVVTGRTARDIGPLCADAYEKAKKAAN